MKVLFSSFFKNGYTAWFDQPQMKKLELYVVIRCVCGGETIKNKEPLNFFQTWTSVPTEPVIVSRTLNASTQKDLTRVNVKRVSSATDHTVLVKSFHPKRENLCDLNLTF